VEQAAAVPVAPTPILPRVSAPIPLPTPKAEVDPLDAKIAESEAALEKAIGVASTDKNPSTLVSGAPEWYNTKYKGEGPAKKNSWAEPLIGMAGGMLTGPKEVALANKDRPMGLKMEDARQLGAAKGLQGLLSSFTNRGADDRERDLNIASKEAGMMRTLPGGSRSDKVVDGQKTLYEGRLRQKGMADLAKMRGHKISVDEMMNSTDENQVPQLQAARRIYADVLRSRGMEVPDLSGTSLASIQKHSSTFNAAMGLESKERTADAAAQNARARIEAAGNERRKTDVEKIKQDENRYRAELANLGDPDFVLTGAVPRDAKTRTELRDAVATRKTMLESTKRLREIQGELDAMSHGFLGPFDKWLGGLTGGDAAKAQKLVSEGMAIQHDLTTKERSATRANLGVPTEWEQALAKSQFPAPGMAAAWLDKSAWDAADKMLNRHFNNFVRARGGGFKSMGDQEAAPYAPEANLTEVAPVVSARAQKAGRGGAPSDVAIDKAVSKYEVAPLPPDATGGQTVPKHVKSTGEVVTPKGSAPTPAQPAADPKKEKIRAIIKQLEGRKLTPEQQAKLDALRSKLNAP
jgi:hypothetical protein